MEGWQGDEEWGTGTCRERLTERLAKEAPFDQLFVPLQAAMSSSVSAVAAEWARRGGFTMVFAWARKKDDSPLITVPNPSAT